MNPIVLLAAWIIPLALPLLFRRPWFTSVMATITLSIVVAGAALLLGWVSGENPGLLFFVPSVAGLISLTAIPKKPPRQKKSKGAPTVPFTPVPKQFNNAQERPRKSVRMKVDE